MTDGVFNTRTQNIFAHQKKRARAIHRGCEIDYALGDLRELVRGLLGRGCPYCGVTITASNFSVDHRQPITRGGSFGYENLEPCCVRCNALKGALTYQEFELLMATIAHWEPFARKNLLARLAAGGKLINRS